MPPRKRLLSELPNPAPVDGDIETISGRAELETESQVTSKRGKTKTAKSSKKNKENNGSVDDQIDKESTILNDPLQDTDLIGSNIKGVKRARRSTVHFGKAAIDDDNLEDITILEVVSSPTQSTKKAPQKSTAKPKTKANIKTKNSKSPLKSNINDGVSPSKNIEPDPLDEDFRNADADILTVSMTKKATTNSQRKLRSSTTKPGRMDEKNVTDDDLFNQGDNNEVKVIKIGSVDLSGLHSQQYPEAHNDQHDQHDQNNHKNNQPTPLVRFKKLIRSAEGKHSPNESNLMSSPTMDNEVENKPTEPKPKQTKRTSTKSTAKSPQTALTSIPTKPLIQQSCLANLNTATNLDGLISPYIHYNTTDKIPKVATINEIRNDINLSNALNKFLNLSNLYSEKDNFSGQNVFLSLRDLNTIFLLLVGALHLNVESIFDYVDQSYQTANVSNTNPPQHHSPLLSLDLPPPSHSLTPSPLHKLLLLNDIDSDGFAIYEQLINIPVRDLYLSTSVINTLLGAPQSLSNVGSSNHDGKGQLGGIRGQGLWRDIDVSNLLKQADKYGDYDGLCGYNDFLNITRTAGLWIDLNLKLYQK